MATEEYTAKNIKTLDQITHVRKRIGMYLGSNSSEGITVGLREALDNSVDEALGGNGDKIIVRFYNDNSAEVQDYGRGLPIDKNEAGDNGIILTVGTIGSGGKFGGKNISGGLNGVGISAMCASSSRFDVTVYRDNKMYQLSFKEGRPGFFDKAGDPSSKFTPNRELKVSKDPRSAAERKEHPTGTTVRFWPDYTVFLPDSTFIVEDIKNRAKATCFLIPGLGIEVEDLRDAKNPVLDSYHFNAGLADMLPTLTHHAFVTKPIRLTTSSAFTEKTNVLQEDGKMKQQEVDRPVDIDVAFGFTNTEDTVLNSYVNIIQTKQGGTHEQGLWRALSRVLINYIKENKYLKAKEEPPTLEDVRDGFVGVISIKFPEPTFTGQAKEALATTQITTLVSQAVGDELKRWIGDKKNLAQVKIIGQKIVEAKRIRETAKLQKDTARKKSALETAASMPAKLVPCALTDPAQTELLICEGISALGGLKQARDAKTVAIYPLRGKPLSVYDTPLSTILKNQEWSDLIQILGAGMGKDFDVSRMRYSRIIILADGDDDGAHIAALVLSGFWKIMKPLITEGKLYIALPPLYCINGQGKNGKRYYALDDKELDVLVKKLAKEKVKYDKIIRMKGLGEFSPETLAETVIDPTTRVLKQINVKDVEAFESVLELTMGKNAADRRAWITSNSNVVDGDDIDY